MNDEFLKLLNFREWREAENQLNESEIAALCADFADKDRELAETDLDEYAANLEREDTWTGK